MAARASISLLAPFLLVGCADTVAPRFEEGAALTLDAADRRVAITWPSASDDRAVTAYVVAVDGVDVSRTTSTGYALTDVPELATHHVVVTAIDEAGNRSIPIAGDVTMPDTTPPAFATDAQVLLTAGPPADGGARVLHAAWSAATDTNGPVRYEVHVEGGTQQILTTIDATTFDALSAIVLPDQRVSVVALDAAGLRSTPIEARWGDSAQAREEQIREELDRRVQVSNRALLRALLGAHDASYGVFGSGIGSGMGSGIGVARQ